MQRDAQHESTCSCSARPAGIAAGPVEGLEEEQEAEGVEQLHLDDVGERSPRPESGQLPGWRVSAPEPVVDGGSSRRCGRKAVETSRPRKSASTIHISVEYCSGCSQTSS